MPEFIDKVLKGRPIVDIGRITLPIDDAPKVVKNETELATDDPAPIRNALLADLRLAASFTTRVQQFNPVTVDHADQTRRGHEVTDETPMAVEQAKKPCSTGQLGK